MTAFSNLKKSKQKSKINVSLIIALIALAVSVFTGCGGDSGSKNNNNNPTPTPTPTYSVSFFTNGGSAVTTRSVQQGGVITASPETTRESYVFDGWFTDNNTFASKVSFPYTPTGNITLYAKWIWLEGTEISTPAQLDNIRNDLAGNYKLAADISLATYGDWEPIGSASEPFTGKIDGDGHKITGMKIRKTANLLSLFAAGDETEIYAGFFGYVKNAEITNLALENVDIIGSGYAGAIAGYAEDSAISNCNSTGDITSSSDSTSDTGSVYAGGIAGYLSNSTISDCYSTGNITSYLSDADASFDLDSYFDPLWFAYSGGIAGGMQDSTITECYSTGNITSSYDEYYYYFYYYSISSNSGGIVGVAGNSAISNCYSNGNISSSNLDARAGGIAGTASDNSLITNCHSMGNVHSDRTSGGITGYLINSTISDCYSTGNVIAEKGISGGIAGISDGSIKNCYSSGNITASEYAGGIAGASNSDITNCYSTGEITSYRDDSGGIVGSMYEGTITNCYSTGNVIAEKGISGGIVGSFWNGTVTNCYSAGNVLSRPSSPFFSSPLPSSGGIAGMSFGGTITNCAAINETIDANGTAGRITTIYGSYDVSLSNNFALTTMTASGDAKFDATNIKSHGIDKTDAELRSQSTYENGLGWKFGNDDDNPWKMPSGGGYPILYWQ